MPQRGLPPVCLLVSDGLCTDPDEEYVEAITKLKRQPWGKKAVRLAIAIGDELDYDEEQLLKFVSHQEIGVLKAHNPCELVNYTQFHTFARTLLTRISEFGIKSVDSALGYYFINIWSIFQNRENLKYKKNPISLRNRIFHIARFSQNSSRFSIFNELCTNYPVTNYAN